MLKAFQVKQAEPLTCWKHFQLQPTVAFETRRITNLVVNNVAFLYLISPLTPLAGIPAKESVFTPLRRGSARRQDRNL